MRVPLYVDVVLAVNAAMNYILLFLTATLAQERSKPWRFCAGSLVGASYALAVLLWPMTWMRAPALKVLCSLAMVTIVFGLVGWRRLLRLMTYFYLLSFLIGGTTLACYYFLADTLSLPGEGTTAEDPMVLSSLILALTLVFLGGNLAWTCLRRRSWQNDYHTKVRIRFATSWVEVPALIDTGNQLVDPLSHQPVILMETGVLAGILPPQVEVACRQEEPDLIAVTNMEDDDWGTRFRVIPFAGLGNEGGMLLGLRPDEVLLLQDNGWHQTGPALVALVKETLCSQGGYHALVPPGLQESSQ